jgi:hypothetical protein
MASQGLSESLPVPTIVQTLVSPMSTCHSAPEDAPVSLVDPRRVEDEDPAELGRRRPLVLTGFGMPPALDVARFFLTRPPSLVRSVADVGEAGALSVDICWPKYSPVAETGVDDIGEPGRPGESGLHPWPVFHWRPSMGR